jgi:outer membrane lipoprotein-sorting protein
MKKYILFLTFFCIGSFVSAQVRLTNINNSAVGNMSAFLDASSNSTNNSSTSVGKGMVFPRVTLSTFTFGGAATGVPNALFGRYDGMLVYNTSTSGTVPASGGNTLGTLTEGYWFYENKSSSLTGGTWKPLGGSNTLVKSKLVLVTVAANPTTAILNLGTAVIASNEVNTFLGAKIYDSSGNLVLRANSAYDKATNDLTTGNGFMYQVLPAGDYEVVVEYN